MKSILSVTHQENSKRKTHRITLPIQVVIKNNRYIVSDWSMSGLKITVDDADKDFEASVNDILDINIILATGESSIILDTQVTLKNHIGNDYGFEITKINDKNKRVLRHYATLALEGNIHNIDDISGSLFMNEVASPIKEPILMSDKESVDIHKSFLQRVLWHFIVSIIFIIVITSTFFYNYLLTMKTVGFTAGNSTIYFAPYNGILKNIYVKKGDYISKGQLLFEMRNDNYQIQIAILKKAQKSLQHEIKDYKKQLAQYQRFAIDTKAKISTIEKQDTTLLKEEYSVEQETFNRAKYLYKNQLLAFMEFSKIQSQHINYLNEYNAVIRHQTSFNKNALALRQSYVKNEDHIISLKNSMHSLLKEIETNKLEIANLNSFIKNSLILANTEGIVYNINRKKGDSLEYADNVLIIETKTKSFVLIKVLTDQVSDIEIGSPCIMVSKRTKKRYNAHVAGIGYPAIDGIYVTGHELSQNEVPIKIEFDDDNVRFNLNEYLDVYITNYAPFAQKVLQIFRDIE